ncbi:hypothetical protein NQ317_010962 [Molorchus minor]|uniref:Secreted protein n=1 Tax=Molorchus minor TaxID=1323400 RepID=A0ABQ9JWY5_9CUCU|nr:hypothetical protein NQ317_010962 [Molorchus minor]
MYAKNNKRYAIHILCVFLFIYLSSFSTRLITDARSIVTIISAYKSIDTPGNLAEPPLCRGSWIMRVPDIAQCTDPPTLPPRSNHPDQLVSRTTCGGTQL